MITHYILSRDELAHLLEYATHRPNCNLVIYRHDEPRTCDCGFLAAVEPVRRIERGDTDYANHVAGNRHVFGGRSFPLWLANLVPAKFGRVSPDRMGMAGAMSDG